MRLLIRPSVPEAAVWRRVLRETEDIADPLRALGYVLWRVDPFALEEHLDAWFAAREWKVDMVRRAKTEGEEVADVGMAAWQLIAAERRFEDTDLFADMAVQSAFNFIQAYFFDDTMRRSDAEERLSSNFYHIPIIERIAVSADIMTVLSRLERWGFFMSAEGAYFALHTCLAKLCCEIPMNAELSARELLALGAAPQRKGRELPEYYARFGDVSKESAMSFYRRVYGKTHYENRPYADEIRRQDRLLYNRLTTALARNKVAGRQPASMLDLFPLRESARGGALAWRVPADEDPHSAAEALERQRAKNREKMRAYRARKKGK